MMNTHRVIAHDVLRNPDTGVERLSSVLWVGDGVPSDDVIAALASSRRDASLRNTAPNSFEHEADTLAVQARRRRFGWKTVATVNMYEPELER